MHKLNLPPLIWPADPGALQTNVIAHPAGASLAKTGIATLSALPRQRMETMMQRHQPILMQDPCVRFLFPADVVSFDFIPGETLGDVAARFGGLGLKRYGKAMAIDITLPAKRRLD